jgi:hypothetical protein
MDSITTGVVNEEDGRVGKAARYTLFGKEKFKNDSP